MWDSSHLGKCCYKYLPIVVGKSPDIFQQKMNDLFQGFFQQKMNDLFQGFEFICAYIDNLLMLTKGYWIDHVNKLKLAVNKWKQIGPKYILKMIYSGKPKWNN